MQAAEDARVAPEPGRAHPIARSVTGPVPRAEVHRPRPRVRQSADLWV